MLLSYGLVRLPGPDSSFKMLLSSEFFVVMMIRIWQSGQVMEFGDLVGAANTGGSYLGGSFAQCPLCL